MKGCSFLQKKRYRLHLTRCRKVALQNLEVFNLGNAFSIIFKQRGFAKDGNKKCAKIFAEMKNKLLYENNIMIIK